MKFFFYSPVMIPRGSQFFEPKLWITPQNLNQNWKYFNPLVSGPDRFQWWKKLEVKNLVVKPKYFIPKIISSIWKCSMFIVYAWWETLLIWKNIIGLFKKSVNQIFGGFMVPYHSLGEIDVFWVDIIFKLNTKGQMLLSTFR